MAKTVQQVVQKWQQNAGAAQGAFTDGVQGTQIDVAARAIAQANVMVANFNESVTSGRWQRGLTESGGTANWKAQTVAKAANYGTGIAAGATKFQNAMSKLLPYIQQGQQQIAQMPSGSIGASKARASAWIDYMAAGKGQFKG
jgi:hypothetical protein